LYYRSTLDKTVGDYLIAESLELICIIGVCQIKVWYYYAGRLCENVPRIVLLVQLEDTCFSCHLLPLFQQKRSLMDFSEML
jgi:hypothetical protein